MNDATAAPAVEVVLLPCPFCGGNAKEWTDLERGSIGIQCTSCQTVQTPLWSGLPAVIARQKWNTRSAQ